MTTFLLKLEIMNLLKSRTEYLHIVYREMYLVMEPIEKNSCMRPIFPTSVSLSLLLSEI